MKCTAEFKEEWKTAGAKLPAIFILIIFLS